MLAVGAVKTCSRCGHTKELVHFQRDRGYRDGLKKECRACATQRMREYRRRIGVPVRRRRPESRDGLWFCMGCEQWLTRDRFAKESGRKDGVAQRCSVCKYAEDKPRRAMRKAKRLAAREDLRALWADLSWLWMVSRGDYQAQEPAR